MAHRVLTEAELLNEKSMGPGVKRVRLALCLEVLEKDGWDLLATTAEGLYVFRRPEQPRACLPRSRPQMASVGPVLS